MYRKDILDNVIIGLEQGKSKENLCKKYNIPEEAISQILTEQEANAILETEKLIKQKKYDEALNEYNRKIFQNSLKIQKKKVKFLIKRKRYIEALEICNQYELYIQKVKVLAKLKRYKEALKICDLEKFKKNKDIQAEKVKILIKLKRYEEVKKLCDQEEFINDENFQNHKIIALLKQRKDIEALRICNRKIFQTSEIIQVQKVKILMSLEKYEEALEICNRDIFQNNGFFINQKKQIQKILESDAKEFMYRKEKTYILGTKLYFNKLNIKDILESNITNWQKTIFLFAYFEKNKSPSGIQYMKKWLKDLELTDYEKKVCKECMEKLKNKKSPFYQEKYDLLIFGKENIIYIEEKEELEVNEQIKQNMEETDKQSPSKEINESSIDNEEIIPKTSKPKEHKSTTLRKKYYKEILKIERYLYLKMQDNNKEVRHKALKAWDALESISSKDFTNIEYRDKLEKILNLEKI